MATGFADGCDRLLGHAVAGPDRERQRRYVGVMLAGPFMVAAGLPAVAAAYATDLAVMVLGLTFLSAWAGIVAVSTSGTLGRFALGAGFVAVLPLAFIAAGLGGLASPALLLAAALPLEAWWVLRNRGALYAGLVAAAAVVLLLFILPEPAVAASMASVAWAWLLPAAYGLSVWMRAPRFLTVEVQASAPAQTLDHVIDCVVLTISAEGDVADAQGATEELLGVGPELLRDDGLFERIHIGDRVAYLSAMADLRDGTAAGPLRLRLRVAGDSGGHRCFRMIFRQRAGQTVAILRDDAENEGLRRDIEAATEREAASDVTKARFLATVSHELRTPLNAIIGFADMLALGMAGPLADPRQAAYAETIRQSGGHLLDLVNAILDASKIEANAYSITPEPFAFCDAAAASHAMLTLQAQARGVALVNGVHETIGQVRGDRRAIQQILINLLSNAVKFTREGGSVRLDARKSGRRLVVEVSDTGIGMCEKDLARIGKPFTQIQSDYARQFDGAGLGLSIAKGLVALHGGAMTIESAEGEGTLVTVVLPIDGPSGKAAGIGHNQVVEAEGGHGSFRKSA